MRQTFVLFSMLACLTTTTMLRAQDSFDPSLVIRVDYDRASLEGFDINDFFRSYNSYYEGVIPMPFDTLSATAFSHMNYGAGIRVTAGEKIGFASGLLFTFGAKKQERTAQFENDIITSAKFRVSDLNVQVDLGVHFYETVYLQAHMTGRFRKTVLELGYFYQDGSYTLGDEYDILGVYTGPTTYMDLGGSLGLKLGPVFIPVTISYPMNWFSDDGLLTLLDYEPRQIRWTDLPRDYETWADDPANVDLDTGFVRMESFKSVRINVGLEIWF